MSRADLIEKAAVALFESPDYLARKGVGVDDARTVLDAVLPLVSTVTELEALPDGAKVLADKGHVWIVRHGGLSDTYLSGGGGEVKQHGIEDELPLTVIWLPESVTA